LLIVTFFLWYSGTAFSLVKGDCQASTQEWIFTTSELGSLSMTTINLSYYNKSTIYIRCTFQKQTPPKIKLPMTLTTPLTFCTVLQIFLQLLHTSYAEDETPEQLLLPAPSKYTGVKKFGMEIFMMVLFIAIVRTIVYVRRANRMAWIWRKKSNSITSWDDFRDAPGYDMVLPPESTVFDTFFYDKNGNKCFSNKEKSLDMAEYAMRIKNQQINAMKAQVPVEHQSQHLDTLEKQNWLHIAEQHWMNSARLGLVMRARALRPLMFKVDQDYPEMKRMHDVGMCDTATFDAVQNAMSMMKAEIKDLNTVAKEVGYLFQDLSKGSNVWNLADTLISFRKHMEELNLKKQQENNKREQEKHKKEKEAKKAERNAKIAKENETRARAKAQADLLAEENSSGTKNSNKNKKSNKRR
jgi:hypothetical protein